MPQKYLLIGRWGKGGGGGVGTGVGCKVCPAIKLTKISSDRFLFEIGMYCDFSLIDGSI